MIYITPLIKKRDDKDIIDDKNEEKMKMIILILMIL